MGYSGTILATVDGGTTWIRKSSPLGSAADLNSVAFADASHGWAVGYDGSVIRTTDGGAHWQAQDSGTTLSLVAVAFSDDLHGWAVGNDAESGAGTIIATSDGGAHWTPQSSPATRFLADLAFTDASHGWAVGRDPTNYFPVVLATTDGGAHWTSQTPDGSNIVEGCSFIDRQHGWVVGWNFVSRTSDGGAHWTTYWFETDALPMMLKSVDFVDATHGWASDIYGSIFATSDGGEHWIEQTSSQNEVTAVFFINQYRGWAVNGAGEVLATRSSGVLDPLPPVTTAAGADAAWHNRAVTVTFSAADAGSGIDATEYRIDHGAWTSGASCTVPAPADCSKDGIHTVSYYSRDGAGNLEAAKSLTVNIDTRGPVTAGKATKGHRGRAIALRYRVSDVLSPQATAVKLAVKNSHGKVVKRFALGARNVATWYFAKWTPKTRGTYRYTITAQDLAGNKQSKAGVARIVVK